MGFGDALAKQKPLGTAKFTFDTITLDGQHSPVLEVRHAGSSNPRYQSELVKMANERRPRTGKLTVRKIREEDEYDAQLIARGGVVVGWEHVYDEPGAPLAECTPDKVEELLLAVIESHREEFVGFKHFCRDPMNFRDGGA